MWWIWCIYNNYKQITNDDNPFYRIDTLKIRDDEQSGLNEQENKRKFIEGYND